MGHGFEQDGVEHPQPLFPRKNVEAIDVNKINIIVIILNIIFKNFR